uniref:Putative secreted protein n=1 Tax=Anopheles darlingi TaxID=43151 RepID=A0A2M4D3S9_ANODA
MVVRAPEAAATWATWATASTSPSCSCTPSFNSIADVRADCAAAPAWSVTSPMLSIARLADAPATSVMSPMPS